MSEKIIFFASILFCFVFINTANAQLRENVYLDLTDEDEIYVGDDEKIAQSFFMLGKNYIDDVKEYDELLEGKAINKDFSDDFKNKYETFNEKKSEEWESYVRNGVKTYRFYKEVKAKIVEWLMEKETPLVVDDDQYEMGEKEKYIKSDKPLVIQDFKKVVAYSGKKRDVAAAEEKIAKEKNIQGPAEYINKIKKAIIEQDWKNVLKTYWKDFKSEIYRLPVMDVDGEIKKAKAVMLPKYQYTNNDGKVEGVILIEVEPEHILLYSAYDKYEGISIKFDNSKNIKDVVVKYILPQQLSFKDNKNILFYSSSFPIYFEAKAEDETKDILIKANIVANVCRDEKCKTTTMNPSLSLKPDDRNVDTIYAAYVVSAKMNVPDDMHKDEYEIGDLVWEKKKDGTLGCLRLDVKTEDTPKFDAIIIGDEIKYFNKPRYSIKEDVITARFDLIDMTFSPLDKEISFWLSKNGAKQYIHKQKVKEMSYFDISAGKMSLGILGFAFLGGMLLNLMPCVFPVLFLKLLEYTKLGKMKTSQIRSNFVLNVAGILSSFVIIAIILAGLKMFGRAIGWGMQFQNTYFLASVLWVVVFFLYYICGLIDFRTPDIDKKIRHFSGSKMFEFLSGVFLVVLSTPCMAPYLGTAFGVALAGDIKTIITTVMIVGLGLSTPYILLSIFPKVAFYFPKPGKWMILINLIMIILMLITFVWLFSILVAQTAVSQIWHWILYILVMSVIVYFWKAVKKEIFDLENKEENEKLYKKFRNIFYIIMLFFIALSFVDVGYATKNRKKIVEESYETKIDLDYIKGYLKNGNKVLLKVGADWCLTCKYNDFKTFDIEFLKNDFENYNVFVIDIDWTNYEHQVLKFMQKFGRSGLPFYVLFSERYPDGIVLSEIVDVNELQALIER